MALQFEAKKVALKQNRDGFILTLALHPDEIPDELIRDFVGARYACALVRINDDESPVQYNNKVRDAGIVCRQPLFQQFLRDEYSLNVTNETEAAEHLCRMCNIQSRTELNGNAVAIKSFDSLLNSFSRWKANDDNF
jgi:hypothetical protein